jgi:uncharacterized UPF0160 family protein
MALVQCRSSLYYGFTFDSTVKENGYGEGKIIEVLPPVTWHDFLNLTTQIFIMDNGTDNTIGKRSKKEFRKTISAKLESSLVEFQNDIKEKKFKAAVKRASKLLANDMFVKQKKKKEKDNTVMAEAIGA